MNNLENWISKTEPITVTIKTTTFLIENHFDLNIQEEFIDRCKRSNDYRSAFIYVIYKMSKYRFHKDRGDYCNLDFEAFCQISDIELQIVLEAILCDSGDLKTIYSEIEEMDSYKRFYLALKKQYNIFAETTKNIFSETQRRLEKISRPFNNFAKITQISKMMLKFNIFNNIIPPTALYFPQSRWSEMSRVLSTAERISFPPNEALQKIAQITDSSAHLCQVFNNQLFDMTNRLSFMTADISKALSNVILPIHNILALIYFEELYEDKRHKEYHALLQSFGWWYLSDCEDELFEQIYDQKGNITKGDVDRIICSHYRKNRCERIKSLIKKWDDLECFKVRKKDLHEICVIHCRQYYNSSVSLLTIHIEGVIRQFIYDTKSFADEKFWKVRRELRSLVESQDDFDLLEERVSQHILNCIKDVYNGSFDASNPDEAPDSNRNKRMHGMAVGIQTEADSLKLILQLNELYNIFEYIKKSPTVLEIA